jgi:NCS2 family nucleobase:cation symporter-2
MFGMIAATGIRILNDANIADNRNNLTVMAVSLSVGMIPLVAHKFFQFAPAVLGPLLHSGILLATFTAVLLNLFLNGLQQNSSREGP